MNLSSAYHSTLFVLGSILSWAIVARSPMLPSNSFLRSVVAISASVAMLSFAKDSLDHIDSRLGNTLGKK